MLTNKDFEQLAGTFTNESKFNYISKEEANDESIIGLRLYEIPLIAYADVKDELFKTMQKPEAVGPQFMLPNEWLEDATTVISFFLPFTDEVKKSNYSNDGIPSNPWLYGRVEGQRFVMQFSNYLKEVLESNGYKAVVPAADERFCAIQIPSEKQEGLWKEAAFTSNWSERHVAFICGLGTFGLSKGLITAKGMAGRFGSIITNAPFEFTKRLYTEIYEYCTNCGACMRRCPAQAISMETGKDHVKCSAFVSETGKKYAPRYGCGKCQVRVPCESKIPKKI